MQQRLELTLPPDVAFDRLKSAAGEVGQVKDVSDTTRSLQVTVPMGPLKWLKLGQARIGPVLRAAVLSGPAAGSSVVEINGPATVDPYGYEKGAISSLVKALG